MELDYSSKKIAVEWTNDDPCLISFEKFSKRDY